MTRAAAFQLNAFQPEAQPPIDTSVDDLIALAGSRKAGLLDRWDAYREAEHVVDRDEARTDLTQYCVKHYLPVLREMRETVPEARLLEYRVDLETRMEKGLSLPPTPKRDATFTRLLRQYEAICDALNNMTIGTWLERMT